jgi:hypothetical protein
MCVMMCVMSAIPAVAWATAMLAMLTARAQKKGTMAYAAAGTSKPIIHSHNVV